MTYIQPLLTLLILVFAFETLRSWRKPGSGKPVMLGIGTLGLFLISWLPMARMAQRPFEAAFPPRANPPGNAQAIVVISGTTEPPSPVTHQRRLGSDTYARCLFAAWLYKHWRALPVLVSGGAARGHPDETPDAVIMQKALEEAGVPQAMIWCEARSHSTHENALYSAAILYQQHIQRIVLVTNPYHMLRAELCFRKEGFAVTPAACDYQSYRPYEISDFFPSWKAIQLNEDLLHEIAGLGWYWIHGWV